MPALHLDCQEEGWLSRVAEVLCFNMRDCHVAVVIYATRPPFWLVVEAASGHLSSMATPTTNEEKFQRWAVQAIDALRKLPEGDGAFAALGIACGLHERFVDASLHRQGKKATPEEFRRFAAADLGVTEEAVDRFYNGYRLGLAHAFHPKNYLEKAGKGDRWGWEIAEAAGFEKHPVIIKKAEGHFVVRIDPWKFVAHVIERWKANPRLHDELKEFSFGNVY